MKKIILSTIFLASSLFSGNLTVEVVNISNSKKGKVSIGLYNKSGTFTNMSKFYKRADFEAGEKKIIYTFKNIPNGLYAVAVIHDENRNNKLDKNFLGIPKEGYGFSNNVRPKFRSANFEESKFELNGSKRIVVKLGY